MTAAEIRERFIQFFVDRGHRVVPSSSLVPAGDPTLLFTNAGMNQFKDVLTGHERRSYRRAVSVQKCVRAGGKHNDLDNVGRTARHQTFFEMLGNWSFGDYGKREAIAWAWEFATQELGLPADRLWATVHPDDVESQSLWPAVTSLPAERVVALEENFWEMADTGPCGPDSELFIDRGAEWACGPDCGIGRCECDRFEEFWNLVFIQYDRDAAGRLTPLPMESVDTGMGLERIAAIVQDVPSNFETDVLRPLITAVEELSGRPYAPDAAGLPFRVIADHARCITMLMADGVQFSNRDRGYVMRRILRRAVRYGRLLGLTGPFLHRLVPVVSAMLGPVYPEVAAGLETIAAGIRGEEQRFHATLEEGLERLTAMLAEVPPGGQLAGRDAFLLYDTYGFPLDLTQDAVREAGRSIDLEGFAEAMEAQRARARAGQATGRAGLPPMPPSRFVGYDTLDATAVLEMMVQDDEPVRQAQVGERVAVYAGATPFYPEGGGQVGDHGTLEGPQGRMAITDVQKVHGAIWHWGEVTEGVVAAGQSVRLAVDPAWRSGAMRNHTGTHLLHAALRRVLGAGARQTGSLVAPDRLRFDFSHPEPLSPQQLDAVETLVNEWILEDRPVGTREEPLEQALAGGAIAFFGDKYGEQVRVVEVAGASQELCGGTHCRRTGQIGQLRVVSDTGIGSGMRRVEAVTGFGALERARQHDAQLARAASMLKSPREALEERLQELLARVREWERQSVEWRRLELGREAERLAARAETLGPWRAVVLELPDRPSEALRELAEVLVRQHGVDVALLASRTADRAVLAAAVGEVGVSQGVAAGRLVGMVAPLVGGGGGGRPDRAQAGGRDPDGVPAALAAAKGWIAEPSRQGLPASNAK